MSRCIKSLGITLDMMLDAPAKGDPTSAMVKQKGKDWIPWQEQWLNGLEALKSGSKIFAILTEKNFRPKCVNESQCDSPAKCAALNFDPSGNRGCETCVHASHFSCCVFSAAACACLPE